jgi:hypothetical protein
VEQICHSGGNEDMIRSNLIIILLIYTLLVLCNFNVYSADNNQSDADKKITINLVNFSEKDYLEYIFPLLPSHGYIFNRNYLHGNNLLNPAIGAMTFYEGRHTIDNKNFYRLSANAFDKNKNPYTIEWDISKGFLGYSFDNRKTEAFKFTTGMMFDSEEGDINTVLAKRLIEAKNISNVNPLYAGDNVIEKINGYEFNYTLQRSSTYRAVRTSIESASILGLGMGLYFLMKDVNQDDWIYRYNKDGAKRKFKDGFRWDPNNFNTNTLYHLYAGSTYYMIARSNDYSILESFAWSFVSSFLWEVVCEWREFTSINDTIFTPTLGALTGEFLIQSSNWVERSMKPGFLRETIVFILYPFGSINRWLDSANSGDIRVRILFNSPVQTALERKMERDVFR